jgi:TonB family protein
MLAVVHGRTTFPVIRAFPRVLAIALCCAAAVALTAAAPAGTQSLGGIVIGTSIETATAVYPQAKVSKIGSISILHIDRPDGGKLTAYSDFRGAVWLVRYDGVLHERGSLEIPCGGDFDLQSSHVNLDNAADQLGCKSIARSNPDTNAYMAPDRSVLVASFYGPGDGALQTAIWSLSGIPASWTVPVAMPTGTCTMAGEEAVVAKRAPLDVSPSDAQKALAAGASRDMDVEVMLGPDGLVKRASMFRSSGSALLDDAAIAAVVNSVYRPKRIRCVPTYGVYQFPFEVPH